MTTYYPQLLASRILRDSDRVSLSAADDGDVTSHAKATQIIIATKIGYNAKDTAASTYKLQWRNVTDAGAFADVASTGECKWAATSGVLTDGTAVTTTTRRCDAVVDQTWQNGLENVGDNLLPDSGTLDLGSDYYTELQWAVSLADGTDGKQYEWRLWNNTSGATVGTCAAQVTTALAGRTGEVAATCAQVTGTIAAEHKGVEGSVAAILAQVTGAVAGTVTVSGAVAANTAQSSAAVAGTVAITGAVTANGAATIAAVEGTHATEGITGTVGATLAQVTGEVISAVAISGNAGATVTQVTAEVQGQSLIQAAVAANVTQILAAIEGQVAISGAVNAATQQAISTIAGTVAVAGNIDAIIAGATAALSGRVDFNGITGMIDATLAALSAAVEGTVSGDVTVRRRRKIGIPPRRIIAGNNIVTIP